MVIYDNTGTILLDIEVDDTSVRYKAIKGENSLMLKFSLDEHIEIPLGSYCLFKGEMYSLMLPEDLTLKHRRDFEYTLVMYSDDAKSQRYKFVNPVDGRLKFSLTAKPKEHLQMFVDNMNMRDHGWSVGECPDQAEVVLSYNHTFCHDALVQLADELKLDYWYDGKVVNLGKLELNKDNPLPLSYGGDGVGLKNNIKRTNYSNALPIEVLFVEGSATNINPSKYGASELHLPKNVTIGYDGSHFKGESGFDENKARFYKTDEKGYSVVRADKEIVNHSEDSIDCSGIEPTHEEYVSSVVVVNSSKHFYDLVFISNIDYSQYVIEGERASVVFQTGMLAGKEFDLATDTQGNLICKKQGNAWRVEIVPQEIDGITMPDADSGYLPAVSDTFKIFGIQLPDEYISEAEWEMLRYAVKHFYINEEVQYTISGELDEIYAKREWDSIKDKIALGSYISFSDKSFQTEPLLIRIIGIKEYVNKPYSPQLEISNAALSGTLVGALNRIENQEVQTEDMFREAIGFTKRRWRDAKETISMLQGAIDGFSEGINPITVETMTMLVGDERLQFVLTDSLTSDGHADLHYEYDAATGTFSVESAYIKHMTLGIDSISPVHTDDEYKRWSVSGKSEVLESESGYYLYAKVSKSNATGSFELSKSTMADDDEWYFLLVGIINSEYGGDRSFASMYGYSEVRPGQITTDNIRSSDGKTWLDLLKGILYLNDMAGVSGVKETTKGERSIAAWFGGLMQDKELDSGATNPARSVIRHDGTGYFADGLFSWNKDQGINLGNGQLRINYDGSVDFGGNIRIGSTGEETLDSLLTIVAGLTDMWHLDADGNVCTDRNVIIAGDTSSGGEGEDTPAGINEEQLQAYLDAHKYVTEDDVAGLIPDVDLSDYYTKSQVDDKVATVQTSLDSLSVTVGNISNTVAGHTSSIGSNASAIGVLQGYFSNGIAKKATADASGNVITSTYATIAALNTVSGRVTTIETWKTELSKYITIADGKVQVSTDLIVTGDTSSGGEGEDTTAAGTVTGIKVNGTTYEPVAGIVTIPDYPTSLTWAAISGKPSFATVATSGSYNDLLNKPTIPTKLSQLTDDVVSGKYLPLTGGTMTGVLTIEDTESANNYIRFRANRIGEVGFADNIISIVDSSNTTQARFGLFGANTLQYLYLGHNGYDGNNLRVYSDKVTFGDQTLIHSGNIGSYNAGSATKLQTARTIWGQSFDGTGNVDGKLTITGKYNDNSALTAANIASNANIYIPYGTYGFSISYSGRTGGVYMSAGRNDGSELYNILLAPFGGNVGIGTTSPAYKLDVAGTGRFTGAVTTISTQYAPASFTVSTAGWYRVYQSTIYSQGDYIRLNLSRGFYAYRSESYVFDIVVGYQKASIVQVNSSIDNAQRISNVRVIFDNTYAYVDVYLNSGNDIWYVSGTGRGVFQNGVLNTGTANVVATLAPVGNAMVIGNNLIAAGDTSSGSDIRFKDVVEDKRIKIEDMVKAPLFTFKWNDREDDAVHLGSSAQYWEKVAPWLVSGEDFKSLNYAVLGVAMGISLAKHETEQDKEIKELKRKVKDLETKIRRMEYGS